jgi:hypothetical protein
MISTLLAEPTEPDGHIAGRATIRISRPPRLDPPYDDERGDVLSTEIRRSRATAQPPDTAEATEPTQRATERDTTVSGSGRAAMAYVRLCVEVLNGYRPPSHLRRIGGPVEFADVIHQIRRRHNAIGHFQTSGRALNERITVPTNPRNPTPLAYGRATPARNMVDPPVPDPIASTGFSLIRLRVSEPRDDVAEVVAVLSRGGTSLAVALRLERRIGTWTCVLVEVV